MDTNELTKREFLKRSLLGVCGLSLGLGTCNLFACNNTAQQNQSIMPVAPPDDASLNEINIEDLAKYTKEAKYYTQTARGIRCNLCPNECDIKPNETGDCRTRVSKDNKLFTIAYGNPCAVHTDPIEKKPLFHFLPTTRAYSIATAGCNLACLNCQNWSISQKSPSETRNFDLMPDKVVSKALENNCKSIAYTYSEPIVFYEYTIDTSKIAHQKGVKNVLVSAGYIHEEPLKEMCKYIDAANIDLKSFSNDTYLKLNGGELKPILNTLKILKNNNVWLEITNLIVPGWTDDLKMVGEMCKWLHNNGFDNTPLHFSRFHPTYKLTHLPPTPVATLEKARNIALKEGLKYVYIGNVPGTEAQNTFCPKCNKKIMERRGYKILDNAIEKGKCKFCGETIPGVWS